MTVSAKQVEAKLSGFCAFLKAAGAEVLIVTNEWEMVRFRTASGTSIVYRTSKGHTTFTGESEKAWQGYCGQTPWRPLLDTSTGRKAPRPKKASPVIRTLRERDGDRCFFCWDEVSEEAASMEHLVPVASGGPSHISNLFLAHKVCNSRAGHLSASEKIALHVRGAFKHYGLTKGSKHGHDVGSNEKPESVGEVARAAGRVATGDAGEGRPGVRCCQGSSGSHAPDAGGVECPCQPAGREGGVHCG